MRTLLLALLLAATPVFGQGVWRLTAETDAMTDKVKRSASTVNSQGHELSVYRGPNNAAWVLFSLGKSSFDTLSPKQGPMYRVDKLQPHDLDTDRRMTGRGLGLDLYRWEPRWINFSIWHGKEAEGRSVKLKELMSGQTAVFRYYLGTGGYKETSFSLEGAGPVIAEALGISLEADPATEAAAEAYRAELLAATRKCQQDMRTFRQCFESVTACEKKSQKELKVLQECLQ
jgi:hypothetical protein